MKLERITLYNTGLGRSVGTPGDTVTFTALGLIDKRYIFALDPGEAVTLGEGLTRLGREALERRSSEQADVIKRMEKG